MDEYLYDFRLDIVARKRCKKYWKNWDEWNILYKTLAYELSSSRDVESYGDVRRQVLEFFPDCNKYIGEGNASLDEITLDIMNGWWFCFKTLFDLNDGRKGEKTRSFLERLSVQMEGITKEDEVINFIVKEYGIDEVNIKSLLEFLKVVYTIGNVTPVSCNVRADNLDSWEYKLFMSDGVKYNENYKDYFFFNDYSEDIKWWDDLEKCGDSEVAKKVVIRKYMISRTCLIIKRGKYIVKRKAKKTRTKSEL